MSRILSYLKDEKTGKINFNGFFIEGMSMDIPSPSIIIDVELWQYLLSIGPFTLTTELPDDKIYTITDKDNFEVVIQSPVVEESSPLEKLVKYLLNKGVNTTSGKLDQDPTKLTDAALDALK